MTTQIVIGLSILIIIILLIGLSYNLKHRKKFPVDENFQPLTKEQQDFVTLHVPNDFGKIHLDVNKIPKEGDVLGKLKTPPPTILGTEEGFKGENFKEIFKDTEAYTVGIDPITSDKPGINPQEIKVILQEDWSNKSSEKETLTSDDKEFIRRYQNEMKECGYEFETIKN